MHDSPAENEITLHTRDGRKVEVRHMHADDWPLLEAMFWKLSPETIWRRFMMPLEHADAERIEQGAKRLATIDPAREVALLALVDEEGQTAAIAVARYARPAPGADTAEGSIIVRDDYQGAGLGPQLFDLLVQVALAQGLKTLKFLTQADNRRAFGLVQHLGLPYETSLDHGIYEVTMQLRGE